MLLNLLVFLGLIFALELMIFTQSHCHHGRTVCRCGITDATFSIPCADDHVDGDPCKPYDNCETCENDVTHCITCPSGYHGQYCHHGGEEAYCENPGSVHNGRKTVLPFMDPRTGENVSQDSSDFPVGVKLVYSCHSGFTLKGRKIIECQSSGSWSPGIPFCENLRSTNSQQSQGCGRPYYATPGKVLHGVKSAEGEWPWQVAYAENRTHGMTITCGAVLISRNTAITAAHCVQPRRRKETFLYFGKYYSDFFEDDENVESRKVLEFIVHPRYIRRTTDNDIALVRFSPDVTYTTKIQPVCLPTEETTANNLAHGAKGWVTGWASKENGNYSDVLMMVELPVVSTGICRENYRRLNLIVQITNNMYCAGFETGGADSCSGDSGGPMVFYNRLTESYILEGIVSFGVRGPTGLCGQKDRYGVYTKVSNYLPWIRQYT